MADSDLQEAVLDALKHYKDLEALQASPLGKLGGLWPLQPLAGEELLGALTTGLAVRRLLDRAIERFAQTYPEAADLLDQNFRQNISIPDIGDKESVTPAAIYARRSKAVAALATIIAEMAAEAAEARPMLTYRQIEALPFRGQLVGFEGELVQVQDALRANHNRLNRLIVITGLGGVGKTSLSCGALRRWLKQEAPAILRVLWARVSPSNKQGPLDREQKTEQALEWVLSQLGSQLELPIAARPTNQRRLEAIAGYLRRYRQRFVIVVDHVKSRAKAQLALTVAKSLLPLAQIIVTSRLDIDHNHNQVQLIRLGELSEAHALELLRLEAKRHGYEPFSDDEAQELYQQVGGHPLALKLLAAQVSCMPVARVPHQAAPRLPASRRTVQQCIRKLLAASDGPLTRGVVEVDTASYRRCQLGTAARSRLNLRRFDSGTSDNGATLTQLPQSLYLPHAGVHLLSASADLSLFGV